ncbi:bifunctional tetrahydrofolate synthase/dihydrofolate synthase [Marinomonas agarivorans]|nr:bifunctional tetrahydrofolate synthase/dihydrofolate synthase [Marinomonas agarivorans]
MTPSSLLGWLSYIESQHPSDIELGLDRGMAVLARLNFERPSKKVITVAGTNGKGSTCAFLTQYFLITNQSVGTFTSPHFIDFNERIAINGQPVSDQQICQAFAHIESIRGDIPLTYFEFNTLAAIWIFSQAKLDYWVLEVGLGGRLDSVNMIDCDIAIVTSIALDHTDWLGDSIEQIAVEKAGIARDNKLFISGVVNPPDSLLQTAIEKGAITRQKHQDFSFTLDANSDTWQWYQKGGVVFEKLPLPELPIENAATTIAALLYLGEALDSGVVSTMIRESKLQGRFQTVTTCPHVILDVAHNPEAALALKEKVIQLITQLNKPVIAVCGMLEDKDIKTVIETLDNSFDAWHLTDLSEPRGARAEVLQAYVTKKSTTHTSLSLALDSALLQAKQENKTIVVFGSFITIGHALTYFKEKERKDA